VQLNNEFRYMGEGYSGEMHGDVLPNDQLLHRNRAHVSVKHNQSIENGLKGFVNFNRVTDDAYFRDLGTVVSSSAQVSLLQEGGFNMNGDGWNSTARVQRYQTLQDPLAPIAVPYARMPQITTSVSRNVSDLNLAMSAEYVEFSHPTAVSGSRLVLNPSVSYPLVSEPAFYVTPKLALHSTQYVMGANNTATLPNATRTLPLFSVDSGVSFERKASFFGDDYLQTLEPRAFYVYVPYRNQSLLPIYDTALPDFNLAQIFTENRFIGSDRIGDANQMTFATTTRVLSESNGAERFKLTLAERFSFITPQVNLLIPAVNTGRSDILLGVGGGISKNMYFDSLVDFDPNQSQTQQYSWMARYRPEPGKTLNFGYQFQRIAPQQIYVPGQLPLLNAPQAINVPGQIPLLNVSQQTDVSIQWPLLKNWGVVARMNYSFPDKRILDSIAGLEYNQSCWTMRFVAQHYTTAINQSNTSIFVQLELNNLMQIGSDPLMVLRQSIPGYTKTNSNPANPSVQ
jgi:LPS-assembly protein